TIGEDDTSPVTGNVLDNDTESADTPSEVVFTDTSASYGTFVDNGDGNWTYQVDTTNGAVQALDDGEFLTDTFEYTLTDADGDTSTATLTVTINGATDGPPTVDIDDKAPNAEGADHSVVEATGNTISGTATVGAEAGIDSVTVEGQDITDASNNPVTLQGDEGTLTITGYDAATGEITYDYTEDGDAEDHGNGEILDQFTLGVTDLAGESTTDSLDIRIEDTEPAASDDSAAIGEDDTDAVTGNVLDNDTESADTPSAISFDADDVAAAQYGTFVDNGDGNWTYQVDTTNGAVQALDDDDTLTETFTYTLTDADGDTSTATLTVTINGATDGPPTVDIDDKAPNAEGADHSVVEATGNTISGTATVGAEAGIDSVTVNDQDITGATSANPVTIPGAEGELRITGYNAATGEITYDYTEDGDAEDHSDGEIFDRFDLEVTDLAGESTTDSLDIRIEDTEPEASDDSTTTEEDTSVTYNVLANDDQGADGSTVTSASLATASEGTGTVSFDENTGEVTFTPASGFEGDVVIDYTITDADGDTSSAQLHVTVNEDSKPVLSALEGSDGVVDEAGLQDGSRPGDGSNVTSGTFGATVGNDSPGNLTIGGVNANGGGVFQGEYGTLEVTDNGDGEYGWTYTLTDNSTEHFSQGTGIDGVQDVFDIELADSEGDTTSGALNIDIIDDVPSVGTPTGQVSVAVSEQSIGDLEARWENMDTTGGWYSVDQYQGDDGVYLRWGSYAESRSGYDFEYADGVTSNTGVTTDSLFSLGTLTHNNFPISGSSDILETIDMVVEFTVEIDGVSQIVETTVGLKHTETGAGYYNGDYYSNAPDKIEITNPDQEQTIIVGDREFVLSIEGFRDDNGNLVDTVRTDENGSTSFDLYAKVSSTDDLPTTSGTIADDIHGWGADEQEEGESLVWQGGIENGVIQGEYGEITVAEDGSYTYELSRDVRDGMDVGETLTESFTYTLTDDDGDQVQGTLDLTLNGEANNVQVNAQAASPRSLNILNFEEFSLAPEGEGAATDVAASEDDNLSEEPQKESVETASDEAPGEENLALQAEDLLSDGDEDLFADSDPVGPPRHAEEARHHGQEGKSVGPGHDEKVVDIPHNPIE
ncbi:Ig-like domain-containing protein, partial [Halomonas sp. I1]|uniref:Ig-like domain-containing protein n=1 Tax=Halomonas sp. I1 TaxID=393536 RepID=UPI0028DEAB7B